MSFAQLLKTEFMTEVQCLNINVYEFDIDYEYSRFNLSLSNTCNAVILLLHSTRKLSKFE